MIYGITIPKNAPNIKAALEFVKFMLSKDKGMRILNKLGQASVIPRPTTNYDKIPKELKHFAAKTQKSDKIK